MPVTWVILFDDRILSGPDFTIFPQVDIRSSRPWNVNGISEIGLGFEL
jgi:hypothetical protein